jgi:hypothetical protein
VKELVCMAPDGSLEVWTRLPFPFHGWDVQTFRWQEYPGADVLDFDWGKQPPEFWGRVVLGEL